MDIITIVFWLILFGLWVWILLLNTKLLKANEVLRGKLRQAHQALEELSQSQSQAVHSYDIEKKLPLSHPRQSNYQAGHIPHCQD